MYVKEPDFNLLCETIGVLLNTPLRLAKGCVVTYSPNPDAKFVLYLYNPACTELVDQREIATIHELIDTLSGWQDY